MAAKLEKTRYPGIFKRGSRYVVTYRLDGVQKRESFATLDEARRAKRAREAARDAGEFMVESRIGFREYALEWVDRYTGRGRNGFREQTREKYRRDLAMYAFDSQFARRRLSQITPRDISTFVATLCEPKASGKLLSDSRVRNIVAPVRA